MGVGLPIYNNSFKWGTQIYAELYHSAQQAPGQQYNFPAGSTVFEYDADSGYADGHSDRLVKFLRPGDRIRIGPSTAEGYEGAYEEFLVTAVTSTAIGVSASSVVAFMDNDNIIGIGSNCPGGWEPDTNINLEMGGINAHTLRTLNDGQGYLNRYSVQFMGDADEYGIWWNFPITEYIRNIYYRMGCYYEFAETGSAQLLAYTKTNLGNIISGTITTSNVTTWTAYNSSPAQGPNSEVTSFSTGFTVDVITTGNGKANIDHAYLEHAMHTDDENSGVYTFDDYPDLGSRSYRILEGNRSLRLANQRLIKSGISGDSTKRYLVTAAFKDVTTDLRDNLEILLDWQDNGKYLVLHHDIPLVPPNLYGVPT